MNRSIRALTALVPLALAGALLAGCTGGTPDKAADTHKGASKPSATKVVPAPAANAATKKVPTDLVGKTMGDAKSELSKAGFTRVIVAGGNGITDATKVADVTHAGQTVPPGTKIVLTGKAPVPTQEPDRRSGSTGSASRCGDQSYWAQQGGAPGDYINACGSWPSWVDRGSTPCLEAENHCPLIRYDENGEPILSQHRYGYQRTSEEEAAREQAQQKWCDEHPDVPGVCGR